MRFLSDENFRLDVILFLKSIGHEVRKAPHRYSDKHVTLLAQKEKRILLTNDSDFSNSLQFPPSEYFGILIFRIHPPRFIKFREAFESFMAKYDFAHIKGKTFIIEEDGFMEIE